MKKPQASEKNGHFFAVCKNCNTILNPQAAVCHACGSTQIVRRSFLDVASRFRDIIRAKTASHP